MKRYRTCGVTHSVSEDDENSDEDEFFSERHS